MHQQTALLNHLDKNHPLNVYLQENVLIKNLIEELSAADIGSDFEKFYNIFNQLSDIEKHFLRKENQLFPYLEKYGWATPSRGMWTFHDMIRSKIKTVRKKIEKKGFADLAEETTLLSKHILQLLHAEESRLFPKALQLLHDEDWEAMYEGDKEIGWMSTPPLRYSSSQNGYIHPSQDKRIRPLPFSTDDKNHFDEGYLSLEQVNFIFKFLPVDITYVDENDRVVFYNRGEERIFPRSAGIIGREVKYCHPPKSVDQVLLILEEFKAGRKDSAEFWIQLNNKQIHIRYFAVRDENKAYKGVIEMSQDITDIKNLEGEKRLLEWK